MPDKPTNTNGIQISCSTQTSCNCCYTANNKQNSFLITDSSSQSCHKQAVGKYITNLPMEINMKIFDFRFPSIYTVNHALISHLQIDYHTIHKNQPSNIKTKPLRREKKLKKVLDFSEYHCVHLIPLQFLFLVILAWNSN